MGFMLFLLSILPLKDGIRTKKKKIIILLCCIRDSLFQDFLSCGTRTTRTPG